VWTLVPARLAFAVTVILTRLRSGMIFRQTRLLILMIALISAISTAWAQPTITAMELTVPNPTNDPFLNWRVIFDQPVNSVTASNFTVRQTGVTGSIQSVTPVIGNQTWTISLSGISGNGTIGVDLSDPTGINGTTAPLTETAIGPDYTVDTLAPYVVSITRVDPSPTSVSDVTFAVQFSEPVIGVHAANFATGGTLTGTVGTPTTTDNIIWHVDITGISGQGTIRLDLTDTIDIADNAGNWLLSDFVGGDVYIIDQLAPTACSTREPLNPIFTNVASVVFRLTVSEPLKASTVETFDFEAVLNPASGFASADITGLATDPDNGDYLVTVGNIVGSPGANFVYDGNSIGNGEIRLGITGEITDLADNPLTTGTVPACTPGEEYYVIDQVLPRVTSVLTTTTDCMTSAIFEVNFSEKVTGVDLSDFELLWDGGDCKGTFTLTLTGSLSRYFVEISGQNTPFHLNGPGNLGLRVLNDGSIFDLVGNSLAGEFTSSMYSICHCFEDTVVWAPANVTSTTILYPQPPPAFDGPPSIACTPDGILRGPFNDTPTTGTTPDFIQWKATEWDCNTSTPFSIYLDGALIANSSGNNTTMPAQLAPGTPNNICGPIGPNFYHPFPTALTPGLHNIRVDINGDCDPGTEFYFNVLDAPVLLTPGNGSDTCRNPRVFAWEPVAGAMGYDLYIHDLSTPYAQHYATVLAPQTYLEIPNLTLPAGSYEWYVQSYNEWGHNAAAPRTFEVGQTVDPVLPTLYKTNGTIYDIYVTPSRTYIAGDFTLVKDIDDVFHSRTGIAAIERSTGKISSWQTGVNNAVYDIEPTADTLLLGGIFTKVYNEPRARIAEVSTVDGAVKPFSPGANGPVYAIEVIGNRVYFGGEFTKIDSQVFNFGDPGKDAVNLAYQDLSTSEPFTSGLNPNAAVRDLLHDGSFLYISGVFTNIGAQPIHALARAPLNGNVIDTTFNLNIHADVSHYVYTMRMLNNQLYFGGSFTSVQNQPRSNAASIVITENPTTSTLTRWNPSPNSSVQSLDAAGPFTPIYLGGNFTSVRGGERSTYLVGVDPLAGFPLTCTYNADRPINAVDVFPEFPNSIHAGGSATITGAFAP